MSRDIDKSSMRDEERMPKVGVVLVNYNGTEDTLACIASLRAQKYDNLLIVVVDNNSDEDTSPLRQDEAVVFVGLDDNVGFGVANNVGADVAISHGAKFVLCLNNDTEVSEDAIQWLVDAADEKTVTTAATYYYDEPDKLWYGGGEISRWKGTFSHKYYRESRDVGFVSGCCILIPASCIESVGLFDDAYFMYYEDGDLSLRLKAAGYTLRYVYEASIYHKVGRSAKKIAGLQDYYLTRNRLYILSKFRDRFAWTAWAYFVGTRALILAKRGLARQDTSGIKRGISDYRKKRMGKMAGAL